MQKKPKSYSAALMDQIPIKYLVTQAQGLQQELGGELEQDSIPISIYIRFYEDISRRHNRKINPQQFLRGVDRFTISLSCSMSAGLHSALLRLLAINYPHLCLVEDWMCEEEVTGTLPLLRKMMLPSNTCRYTESQLHQGAHHMPLFVFK